jgi:hypothetical protein
VEANDGVALPRFEPVIAGNLAVVLVGLPVALLPAVELARAELEPAEEALGRDLGLLRPPVDEVDERVAGVVRNPAAI